MIAPMVINHAGYLDEYFKVVISENKMEARLLLKRQPPGQILPEAIKEFLTKEGVRHGIIEENLESDYYGDKSLINKSIVVAKGQIAKLPVDSEISYFFSSYPNKVGTMKEDGTIDFKDRGEIPHVKIGDLLASKKPAIPGEDGINVNGKVTPVNKPKDDPLRTGRGARVTPDKLQIIATLNGMPVIDSKKVVSVLPELILPGDIDMTTGHIVFEGAVVVKGVIHSGFSVKCEKLVAQEIMKADIKTTGDIHVNGGIIGSNISCLGSVEAKFIQSAQVYAVGTIDVYKEIIDSHIETYNDCIVQNGRILSSKIYVENAIRAHKIGSDVSSPCLLSVGIKSSELKQLIKEKYGEQSISSPPDKEKQCIAVSDTINGAMIKSLGSIEASTILYAKIKVMNNLEIKNEIIDSKIESSGACNIKGGRIISSNILAFKGIYAWEVGSKTSSPCQFVVGVKSVGIKRLNSLKSELAEINGELNTLKDSAIQVNQKIKKVKSALFSLNQVKDKINETETALREKYRILKQKSTLDKIRVARQAIENIKEKQTEVDDKLGKLNSELADLSDKLLVLKRKLKSKKEDQIKTEDKIAFFSYWASDDYEEPIVQVSGVIYENTRIKGPETKMIVKETLKSVTIQEVGKLIGDELSSEMVIRSLKNR